MHGRIRRSILRQPERTGRGVVEIGDLGKAPACLEHHVTGEMRALLHNAGALVIKVGEGSGAGLLVWAFGCIRDILLIDVLNAERRIDNGGRQVDGTVKERASADYVVC